MKRNLGNLATCTAFVFAACADLHAASTEGTAGSSLCSTPPVGTLTDTRRLLDRMNRFSSSKFARKYSEVQIQAIKSCSRGAAAGVDMGSSASESESAGGGGVNIFDVVSAEGQGEHSESKSSSRISAFTSEFRSCLDKSGAFGKSGASVADLQSDIQNLSSDDSKFLRDFRSSNPGDVQIALCAWFAACATEAGRIPTQQLPATLLAMGCSGREREPNGVALDQVTLLLDGAKGGALINAAERNTLMGSITNGYSKDLILTATVSRNARLALGEEERAQLRIPFPAHSSLPLTIVITEETINALKKGRQQEIALTVTTGAGSPLSRSFHFFYDACASALGAGLWEATSDTCAMDSLGEAAIGPKPKPAALAADAHPDPGLVRKIRIDFHRIPMREIRSRVHRPIRWRGLPIVLTSGGSPSLKLALDKNRPNGKNLILSSKCASGDSACIWLRRDGMLVSAQDSSFAVGVYPDATEGAEVRAMRGCRPKQPGCMWLYTKGIWVSKAAPHLAMSPAGGAKPDAPMRLAKGCHPGNPDCQFRFDY